ncbi:MAG: TldD/PmbA family protein [Spirochaetales bacterium]|nr:TldD/PmbA family protein [Spirochaetales bacterium]
MKDLRKIASRIEAQFASKKISKYSYNLVAKETRELSAENGEFSLLRTLFDNNATLSAYKAGKNGVVRGNDFSDAGIDALVSSAALSAESAMKDSAHDISPEQEAAKFRQGCLTPDFDKFFGKMKELLGDIRKEYPKIQIMNVIGEYIKTHSLFRNSNGVDFEETSGAYAFMIEFAGHEGDKTTSLDYCSVVLKDLDRRFIDMGNVRYHLDNAQKQLNQVSLTGKFTGSIIMTPELFAEFLMMVQGNYLSDGVLIDGTSLWKKKIGKQVADEKLTFTLKSKDKRLVVGERYTADGFRTEDLPIIEKGILKNFTIGLYAAKKTKKPVSKNSSRDYVINPGKTPLEEMIASVKKGLIVGGFSGGQPSTNGEFSGVAKNSYYVEDGKIKGAVSEVMINGNLGESLMNIRALSQELVIDGSMVAPYALIDNIVVSGK